MPLRRQAHLRHSAGFWVRTATLSLAVLQCSGVATAGGFTSTAAQATTSEAALDEESLHRQAIGVQAGIASDDTVRVVVRSYETAAISAEINARITYLPQREGDRFRKGDIIVEFDCSRINAEYSAALAVFRARQSAYETQRHMQSYQAAGALAVDQARFEMDKAFADVEGITAKRSGCSIHAPFDGRVIEKAAQVHEIAQPNQPLIRIINESKLELVVMVPSAWLARVTPGTTFSVRIDESGERQDARIVQSTGLIDPVSQSARLIAEIVNPSPAVLPGMSGSAVFSFTAGTQ